MKNQLFLLLLILSWFVQGQEVRLLVGTYTQTSCESNGIYTYSFNQESGEVVPLSHSVDVNNPSFLTWNNSLNRIYSANENGNDSEISAFNFNIETGSLQKVNNLSMEADPCNILLHNNYLYVANYSGGSLSVVSLNQDGSLKNLELNIRFQGKGKTSRQEKSHLHQVQISPDQQFLVATDLGTDYLYVFKINSLEHGIAKPWQIFKLEHGDGPRHLVFDEKGEIAYLVSELSGWIYVLNFNKGNFTFKQKISVLPKGYKGEFRVADIHISKDQKNLYVTNRDAETQDITVFEIQKNKNIKKVQNLKTMGLNPRNFQISPNQKWILIANQDSNEIALFRRNFETGKLQDSGKRIEVCALVFVSFLE